MQQPGLLLLSRRRLLTGLLLALSLLSSTAAAIDSAAGEAIYRRGVLVSGQPLVGHREAGLPLRGGAAACVNCHRRSGLGALQGRVSVPPVAGPYLVQPRNGADPDLPFVQTQRGDREPYTEATLARAIREGVNSDGRSLGYLMPRFDLPDADLAALVAYLKQLTPARPRGASDQEIHFATIIAADADAAKRNGMLSVLEAYFADRNAAQRAPAPRLQSSERTAFSKAMVKARPRWVLHVWQLDGAAETWAAQLDRHLAEQPVFAVVSGLAGTNWAPVHAFCERAALPCLFPNVDAPPAGADQDFYTLYFSRGVLLEADLIAAAILAAAPAPLAVRQVYRAGDVGEVAARALAASLKRHGMVLTDLVLPAGGAGLTAALASIAPGDAVALWLRADDLAALADVPTGAPTAAVHVSGLMGGLERMPLPPAWRERAQVTYPVDLPDRRRVRVDYALGWFKLRHIAAVAPLVQVDTYLACGLLSETLSHMVDTFVRDYLVERIEDLIEHRILTGYYPRLSLGQGQRFASKGGYLVRFADSEGTRVVAEHEWQVPP
jgi:cytochrome c553